MNTNEVINVVIPIISFVIALLSLLHSMYNSHKINKFNMRNNYFDIFKEDLTETIPRYCSKFISEDSNILNDEIGKEFEQYISEFRTKVKFLMYIDRKKYKKLDTILIDLEEEVILLPTRTKSKNKHIKKFNKLIKRIYKKISKHFS